MNMIPLICLACAALTTDCDEAPPLRLVAETQQHMGTDFTIQLYAREGQDSNTALAAAFKRVAQLDQIMSDYNPESELSRLGATSPQDKPVAASQDLWRILRVAQQVSKDSEGAFDVTVGPLTRLWRQARRQKKLPDADKLQASLAAVGYQHMEVSEQGQTVRLKRPNMRLDLGGIAQGYAAQEALKVLQEHGFSKAMVNASGDIIAGDPPPEEKGWKVALTSLDQNSPPTEFVYLANGAVTNSGDAFQFTEVHGKRYSHIVDPKTGIGLTTRMSVTVWHPDGTMADALDSAVCVLGPKKGLELIDATPNCAALLIFATDDGVQVLKSKHFSKMVQVHAKPAK